MRWLILIGVAVATVAAYQVPPAKAFPQPELARIIFFHLPCAYATAMFAIFAAITSWRYLATRQWIWEFRALAATEMALTLGCATMLTGILFSKVQWGAWWSWDPRQTSFLIVLLLLGAYFAVRMAFDEDVARARAAAVFSSLTLLPILFLIFVFPKLPQVKSLHPKGTVISGGFSPDYWTVVLTMFALMMAIAIWLYRMHVRTSVLTQSRDNHGDLEDSGRRTTAHRVDQSVSVHESDREPPEGA